MTLNRILLEMLARHSKSLTYFSIEIHWALFYLCNWNVQGELSLLQCTNLEQLVLSSLGSCYVTYYPVSEQYTKTYGGVEDTPILDQSFANYCPTAKITNIGDRQPGGIQSLHRVLPSVTGSSDL